MSKTIHQKSAEDYDDDMRHGRSGLERKEEQSKRESKSYFANSDHAAHATFHRT